MKFMNKQLFAVIALFGVTNAAFGYSFTFHNNTSKPVAVKLNLVASMADFDDMAVVMPGKPYTFSFTGLKSGFCLSKISYGAVTTVKQNYPSFVEAAQYVTVAATKYAVNVCQSLAFDITEQYGGGLALLSSSK